MYDLHNKKPVEHHLTAREVHYHHDLELFACLFFFHLCLGHDDEHAKDHDDLENDEHKVGHHGNAAAPQVLAHLGKHATCDQDVEHHASANDDLCFYFEDFLRGGVCLEPRWLHTVRHRL